MLKRFMTVTTLKYLSLPFLLVTFLVFQNFTTVSFVTGKGGNGYAVSWDSRFLILNRPGGRLSRWELCMFDATMSKAQEVGERRITNALNGQRNCTTFIYTDLQDPTRGRIPVIVGGRADHNVAPAQYSRLFHFNALSIAPVSGDPMTGSYASDSSGAPVTGGDHQTYHFYLYTQLYQSNELLDASGRPVRNPETVNFPANTLGFMEFKLTFKDFTLTRTQLVQDWRPLQVPGNNLIIGMEPSHTSDGNLMIYQSFRGDVRPEHPDSWIYKDYAVRPDWGFTGSIFYSYNSNPANPGGWSTPKSITQLFSDTGTVNGESLKSRYPIARHPLRSSLGEPYAPNETFKGAYAWISWEGADIFFTAANAYREAVRSAWSVVGDSTGGQIRVIDGGFREYSDRNSSGTSASTVLFTNGLAANNSIWNPYLLLKNPVFPTTGESPVMLLMHSNGSETTEVSFKGYKDGNYLTYLGMNKGLRKMSNQSFWVNRGALAEPSFNEQYDWLNTPDISGRNNFGRLYNDAVFFESTKVVSATEDFLGQHVRFKPESSVFFRYDPTQFNRRAFSVELMARPLADLNTPDDGLNRYLFLAFIPGVMNIILEENRQLQVTLYGQSSDVRTGRIGTALALDKWSHVGVTWNQDSRILQVFLDAVKVFEKVLPPGTQIRTPEGFAYVGPTGKDAGGRNVLPYSSENRYVLALDEFKLSAVVRSADEFADSAHIPKGRRGQPAINNASAIKNTDLRVMGTTYTVEAAQLGSLLFRDRRLSATNAVSCMSCHDSSKGFSDGVSIRRGLTGVGLDFHSPTLVNRALGRRQNWTGKFATTLDQVWAPLGHPNEMGVSQDAVVTALNNNSEYKARFRTVFKGDPSAIYVQEALAAFVNSITSGKSDFDRYLQDGESNALSANEKRGMNLFFGKARCAACHNGPNFSDELMHDTGIFQSNNGQQMITGRRVDLFKMKTPSLRNLASSAPYFHNGSARNLDEVLDAYVRAGSGNGITKDPEIRPIDLSLDDREDLKSFLLALDSPVVYAFPVGLDAALPGGTLIAPAPVSTTPLPATLEFTSGTLNLRGGETRRSQTLTLAFRTTGVLTLSDSAGKTLWVSSGGTRDCSVDCQASFTSAGNLILSQKGVQYWSMGSVAPSAILRFAASAPHVQVVDAGTRIPIATSEDSKQTWFGFQKSRFVLYGGGVRRGQGFFFTLQTDGNFVLYAGGRAVWATGTTGRTCGVDCRMVFQSDGNLVLYQGSTPIWASRTERRGELLGINSTELAIVDASNNGVWGSRW